MAAGFYTMLFSWHTHNIITLPVLLSFWTSPSYLCTCAPPTPAAVPSSGPSSCAFHNSEAMELLLLLWLWSFPQRTKSRSLKRGKYTLRSRVWLWRRKQWNLLRTETYTFFLNFSRTLTEFYILLKHVNESIYNIYFKYFIHPGSQQMTEDVSRVWDRSCCDDEAQVTLSYIPLTYIWNSGSQCFYTSYHL